MKIKDAKKPCKGCGPGAAIRGEVASGGCLFSSNSGFKPGL